MKNSLAYYIVNLRKNFAVFCDDCLEKWHLTHGLVYFLLYIGKHPQCTPGNLAYGLRADTGHTARSIEKLLRLGYISKERSKEDMRAYFLSLTEQGKIAFYEVTALFAEWDQHVCEAIGEEKRQEVLKILDCILKTGDDYIGI